MFDILKSYSLLKDEDKKEIEETIIEKLKDVLIEKLEKRNFEGFDASLEESLFEYGVVCDKNSDKVIISNQKGFSFLEVSKETLVEYLQNMGDGFFSYVGEVATEYIQSLKTTGDKASIIFALLQYGGSPLDEEEVIPYTLEEMIENI